MVMFWAHVVMNIDRQPVKIGKGRLGQQGSGGLG